MALTTTADLLERLANPSEVIPIVKNSTMPSGVMWSSAWLGTGFPVAGAIPGAAAIPTNLTAGALGQANGGSGDLRVWCRSLIQSISQVGMFMLADRLCHSGGLDATNTGVNTISTPALTRGVSGIGNMMAVEIYGSIGTYVNATVVYLNESGATKTAPVMDIGGSAYQNAPRILPISLFAGDRGVTGITSIQLSGSTGTAGNYGVVIYKPLLLFPISSVGLPFGSGFNPLTVMGGNMPIVEDDACLWMLRFGGGQSNYLNVGDLCFLET